MTVSAAAGDVHLLVGDDEQATLRQEELDRLLDALAALELHAAATVAEDIAALRLAGGPIRLLPTEAELEALRLALAEAGIVAGDDASRREARGRPMACC